MTAAGRMLAALSLTALLAAAPAGASPFAYLQNALANNDEYQAALTGIEERELGISIAEAALLPQVRGGYSYLVNPPEREQDSRSSANVGLTQRLFNLSSKAEVEVAVRQLELARAQAAQVRQQILLETYQAYLQASLAQESLVLLDRRRDNLQEQLNVAISRYEVGEATLLPVLNVRAALANLRADRLTANNDLAIALDNLRHLTGSADTPVQNLLTPPQLPAEGLEIWQARAHGAPPLRINATQIEIQGALIDQFAATVIPSLTATASTDLDGAERVALEVDIPIYSSGGATAAIERAKLQARALVETRESLLGEMRLAISTAWRSLNVQRLRRDALAASVAAERERLDLALASVELEAGVLVDAFDAATTLAEAELELARARHSQLQAWLNMLAATGNLDPDRLELLEELFG